MVSGEAGRLAKQSFDRSAEARADGCGCVLALLAIAGIAAVACNFGGIDTAISHLFVPIKTPTPTHSSTFLRRPFF